MKLLAGRAGMALFCVLVPCLAFVPTAAAQGGTSEFTLTPTQLSPTAVAPGGVSSSTIQIAPAANSGFTGSVALTCQVTATIATTDTPTCDVSPSAVTAPGSATATLTTTAKTTNTLYTVTITGTGPTTTYTSDPLQLTVLAVTAQFTITIESAIIPSSVVAGSGAQGVISVNPANGYSGHVTLSCIAVSPLVAFPPYCSFSYPGNVKYLDVPSNNTATIIVNTFGPVPIGAQKRPRSFYALWFFLPMLTLVGMGAATGGKRSRKVWGLLALFVVCGSILLLPACTNAAITTTASPNGTTPANTYTFTIVGVDENGNTSSNSTATAAGPTVTLTVTTPK
ncbi:MAG TPA: hypothetical protein VGS27_18350 [Candidatus Sulfotelmatobacter sp.]|nr:hypothetical protein [Candidatus Sulfotelmatobacter sp.]